MPKWLVLHTLTQPEPCCSALSMAIWLAFGPTTKPSPLSPSIVATLAFSRMILIFGGIDSAQLKHFEIGMQARHAVGVDAAQVASGQDVGGLFGVVFRHAEMHEHLSGKIPQASIRK